MYEVIYDWDEETRNVRETFQGTWTELQEFIKDLRQRGYYNISATDIGEP